METKNELTELVDLADGITTRLNKASTMLTVLRDTKPSHFNDKVMQEYAQTVQDLVDEANELHNQLWQHFTKSASE
jgi:uncharacterized protein Yka (UPF0111/DUF47 family)